MSGARAARGAGLFWGFVAIYIVWGSTYLAIRVLVAEVPPFLASGTRMLTAGGLLYGWSRHRGAPAPPREAWTEALLLGGLLFLIGNGGISWAETRLPSGLTALLAATSPLFTAIFSSARGGWHRPPLRVVLGLIAGLGGVALLVAPGEFIGGGHADLAAAAAITLAAMGWAAGSVLSHAAPLPASAPVATAMKMITGGTLLLLVGLAIGEGSQFTPAAVSARALGAWLYLIVFGSLIGFSAFTYLLRVSTPQRVSTSAFVNPLVAVLLGWAILGEPVTLRTVLGAAVIVGGVMLIRFREAEPGEA